MTRNAAQIDTVVAALAPVRDEELAAEAGSAAAAALLATILDSPADGRSSAPSRRRSGRVIAFAAAVLVAAALSIPAFGVGQEIVSFFAGWRSEPDYPAPVPTASDVVLASGEHGVAWKLVTTRSDQGLCLALVYRSSRDEEVVDGGCGYVDLHGELDPEFRGDPATKCLATPTKIVPCGSLPRRWIDFPRWSDGRDWDRMIVFGVAALHVASVDLVLTNGRRVNASVVQRPEGLGAPLSFYWAALPLDDGYRRYSDEIVEPLEMVVARDAQGRILERRVPAWNGNPTGDPDGPPPPDGA